jgi:hypothetical protein
MTCSRHAARGRFDSGSPTKVAGCPNAAAGVSTEIQWTAACRNDGGGASRTASRGSLMLIEVGLRALPQECLMR